MSHSNYVLGSSQKELSRLSLQSQVIAPVTERLLREAGIKQGMRILDLGCGAGDLSIFAAELVGPDGSVVGIDSSVDAIERARARIGEGDFPQIDFHVSSVEEFSSAEPFDIVIGRFVLIHQAVPADFIRAARRHVRKGGVIAFHDMLVDRPFYRLPVSPLWQKICDLCLVGFTAFQSPDATHRMLEHFQKSGLSHPRMFAELPIDGGPNSLFYAWGVETLRAIFPVLEKLGVTTREEISIDTLEERIRSEVNEMHCHVEGPVQVCAWTTL